MKIIQRGKLAAGAVLSLPLIWTILFMFVPYAILFVYSFWQKKYPTFEAAFQFGNYFTIFTDPQYFQVLLRTGKIAAFVSFFSALLAYPFAYFLIFKVKTNGTRQLLYMAVIAPLWISYLLRAYTWKTILGTNGILNSFLIWTGITNEPTDIFLYNQFAMILTLTYVFIPFMVMPIYTSLEKIPKNLIEASADLGLNGFMTFVKVTLPLSIPGLVAGFTLTFCLSFGDFIASFLVGGPDGLMIANVISSQFGAALNWPLGSALAIIMLIIVLAIISVSDRFERLGAARL